MDLIGIGIKRSNLLKSYGLKAFDQTNFFRNLRHLSMKREKKSSCPFIDLLYYITCNRNRIFKIEITETISYLVC